MPSRIVIIQGHPDPAGGHYCHALADAYAKGAQAAGHEVRRVEAATLDAGFVHSQAEWLEPAPDVLRSAQDAVTWANHMVFVYPLWLGTMPALLKGFLEQTFRPGFAFETDPKGSWSKRLGGRSARIVITMGMPALAYRWYFGAHSLKRLERNILGFCGIRPLRASLLGSVEAASERQRRRWLATLRAHGRRAR
jgi:putative NADPH-quinone reductase